MSHSKDNDEVVPPAVGARLEAVNGPLKGRVFRLTDHEISIGRDPSNEISLLDGLVSRRHCVIRSEGEGFRLHDLDSRNNTFVTGVPVRDRVLVHGDEIRIGNSIFIFQGGEREIPTDSAVLQLDLAPTPGGATVVLRKEDVLYLRPSTAKGIPATARTVRDLNALLEFSRDLNSVRGVAAVQEKVLEAILEISPADRVAILLTENGMDGITSTVGRDRRLGTNQAVHASQTILDPRPGGESSDPHQ